MNKAELKRRLRELAQLVMEENIETDKLMEYLREMEALVEIYRSNVEYENPPPSSC